MDLQEMLEGFLRNAGQRREMSKHRKGHVRDDEARLVAYRAQRRERNRQARQMRAIQRRRDRQSSKRQRSGI